MTTYSFRLTSIGKLGAALFVLPTPIAGFHINSAVASATETMENARTLDQALGRPATLVAPDISPTFLLILGTATLIGAVMLLIGREVEAN